ncbi:MAG TPA: hypothetical protein VMV46_19720 [Thermoanaerobaculia bacterium]|nr:hypothetical protein [Thermoanaerobaculia bacterium]
MTMKKHRFEILVSSLFAATVLALAAGAIAQSPPPPASHPAGHQSESAAGAEHAADLKEKCQAMMARKQETRDTLAARDLALDELLARMNAATSQDADAMVQPMAAVLNELVAQRKANRPMMMEMQSEMMAHMMRHMELHGTKGAMECPMMKMGMAHESAAKEKKPTL